MIMEVYVGLMEIRFESDNDLPLGKTLNIFEMMIVKWLNLKRW